MAASKAGFMKDAFILFAITLVSGICLGFVYEITKGPIEQATIAANNATYQAVLPAASQFDAVEGSEEQAAVLNASGELSRYGKLYVATEDGSAGTKGTVMDAVKEEKIEADVIFACGPKPMLRAIRDYALEQDIPCWISMEEKMACGIGACLACTCQSVNVDDHSHVKNKRVCKDGPVFLATEVEL